MDLIKHESAVMEEEDESLDLLEAAEPPLLEDDVVSAGLDFKHEDLGFSAAVDDKCRSTEHTDHEHTLLKKESLACLEEKREALRRPDQEYEAEQEHDSVSLHLQQQHSHCDQEKEQELRMPSPLQPTNTDARPQDQLSVLTSVSATDATTKPNASLEATTKLPALSGNKRPPPMPVTSQSFSWNDILRVQNLIERCLQKYLSKVLTGRQEMHREPTTLTTDAVTHSTRF